MSIYWISIYIKYCLARDLFSSFGMWWKCMREKWYDIIYGKGIIVENRCNDKVFNSVILKVLNDCNVHNKEYLRNSRGLINNIPMSLISSKCSITTDNGVIRLMTRIHDVNEIERLLKNEEKKLGMIIDSGYSAEYTKNGMYCYKNTFIPRPCDIHNEQVFTSIITMINNVSQANFLLCGDTGSGKSSIIKAIAGTIDACIIVTSLDSFASMSDFRLFINSVEYKCHSPNIGDTILRPKKKIILFEDIDKKVSKDYWSNDHSDLTSLLDGIIDNDSCYIFFTAENTDSLPYEFHRSGRMNTIIVPKVSIASIANFIRMNYGVMVDPAEIHNESLLSDLYYYKSICTNYIDFLARLNA